MIALADANNFYVSCERAFAPRLEGQPVAALSNNDGCVISRSAECKALKRRSIWLVERLMCSIRKMLLVSLLPFLVYKAARSVEWYSCRYKESAHARKAIHEEKHFGDSLGVGRCFWRCSRACHGSR